jgi:hypothetical protein
MLIKYRRGAGLGDLLLLVKILANPPLRLFGIFNREHLKGAKKPVVGWRSLCVAQTSRSDGI